MAKNGHAHEGRKVRRSDANSPKFFSLDSYDLNSMSCKFSNDIFITFEMPGSSYSRPVGKVNISLLFCPSVIRGPWVSISREKVSEMKTQLKIWSFLYKH